MFVVAYGEIESGNFVISSELIYDFNFKNWILHLDYSLVSSSTL